MLFKVLIDKSPKSLLGRVRLRIIAGNPHQRSDPVFGDNVIVIQCPEVICHSEHLADLVTLRSFLCNLDEAVYLIKQGIISCIRGLDPAVGRQEKVLDP